MKRICVYCGSNTGARPEYLKSAIDLGKLLAKKNIELVYGGAEVGLMGAVASATMESGGKVIGVIPKSFADKVAHNNISELFVVPNMHERKTKMFDLSDGFIALPGGMGTIEELFEILTWAQLGLHSKPTGLINICGYYNGMLEFLDNSVSQQFLKHEHQDMLLVDNKAENLLTKFQRYKAPKTEKWINRN